MYGEWTAFITQFRLSFLDLNDILRRGGLSSSGTAARDQLMAHGPGPPPGLGGAPGGSSITRPSDRDTATGGTPGGSPFTHPLSRDTAAALAPWGGVPGGSHFFTRPADDTTDTAAASSAPFTWRRLQVEVAGEVGDGTWQGGY